MDIPRLNITNGTATFALADEGEGVPIVFLHAGVADHRMWQGQIELVEELGYRAIAYDRRGFGGTTCDPAEEFSHVEDLDAVLDALDLRSAVLVGCSQGGRIAIDFALKNPDRAIALVLVGTGITGAPTDVDYPDEYQPLIAAYEMAEEGDDPDIMNKVEAHAWLDGPGTPGNRVTGPLRDLFLDMNGIALGKPDLTNEQDPPPAWDRVGRLHQPALLVTGSLDWSYILERHDHLEAEMENAFAAMIEDTAHLPSLERPDLFNPLLAEFLDALFGMAAKNDLPHLPSA